ncbi:hypothetical protein SpCBS45565_g00428 [Spizellomyces sp. 'palustris']|nr:hypothetical protein SpCBS45565_g00428 [Spizellomyces sp. 'palustris']
MQKTRGQELQPKRQSHDPPILDTPIHMEARVCEYVPMPCWMLCGRLERPVLPPNPYPIANACNDGSEYGEWDHDIDPTRNPVVANNGWNECETSIQDSNRNVPCEYACDGGSRECNDASNEYECSECVCECDMWICSSSPI